MARPKKTRRNAPKSRRPRPKAKARRSTRSPRPSRKAARKPARRAPKPRHQVRKAKPRAKATRPKRTRRIAASRPAPRQAPRKRVPRLAQPQDRAARPLGHAPLDRARRTLSDDERLELAAATSTGGDRGEDRLLASARTGHDTLVNELKQHTETSPALTAGDADARWQDAYSVGDEAPGGDNPTPDQDRVDDIGKALGIQYQDDQELRGGDEVVERDRHRWEFDPASSDDWPHDKKS
ncbi:MAG TPA: DUF6335 family protein [Vicinamibacterales bacterium]|nr:DUF6335 family protein [Vicinamibacterales bacterium]